MWLLGIEPACTCSKPAFPCGTFSLWAQNSRSSQGLFPLRKEFLVGVLAPDLELVSDVFEA